MKFVVEKIRIVIQVVINDKVNTRKLREMGEGELIRAFSKVSEGEKKIIIVTSISFDMWVIYKGGIRLHNCKVLRELTSV